MREIHRDSTLQEDRRLPGRQERIVQKNLQLNRKGPVRQERVMETVHAKGDRRRSERVIKRPTFPPDYIFLQILFVLKISPVLFRLVSFYNSYF
jgi:hypothetical protein